MKTIAELRTERGLSQRGLAKLLGVTSQAVLYWEQGKNTPTVRHLQALARLFNVPMDAIDLDPPRRQLLSNVAHKILRRD